MVLVVNELQLYQDLQSSLNKLECVPTHFEIKVSSLKDSVHLKFLYDYSSKSFFMFMTDSITDEYRKNLMHSITQDFRTLVETSLRNLVGYTSKGKINNKSDDVSCKIIAAIDCKTMKIGETLNITITIPCYSTRSSRDVLEIFNLPLKVLLPIADVIDEIEIHSSRKHIDRVVAKINNLHRDDLDYIFAHSDDAIFHKDTAKQWLKQLLKVYKIIIDHHGCIISIPCVDGLLGKFIPLEIRAEHQFFEGHEPQKDTNKNNRTAVYRADSKTGENV